MSGATLDDTPRCEKCGEEITTGIMFALCPYKDQCALFPHDSDEGTKAFARELIWPKP